MTFELAQVNIARLAAELDTPQLRDFVDSLDPINALADGADGFRWRLQTEEGDATGIVAFTAEQRLQTLRESGSTPEAFTLKRPFPPQRDGGAAPAGVGVNLESTR